MSKQTEAPSEFTRIYHPTLPAVKEELTSNIDDWLEQGWVTEEPDYPALQADFEIVPTGRLPRETEANVPPVE